MCAASSVHHINRLLRQSLQVQAPAMSVPTDAQFFSRQDPTKPDIAFLKNHFYREGRVTEDQAMWILEKATALLRSEPNVLQVDAPITGECACHLTPSSPPDAIRRSHHSLQSVVISMANMCVQTFVHRTGALLINSQV